MTIYLVGAEVGTFTPQTSDEYDTGGVVAYNSTFARAVMYAHTSVSGLVGTLYTESVSNSSIPDEFWLHVDVGKRNGGTGNVFYLRTATTDVLRLQIANTSIQVQALISSVWTNVGSAISGDFNSDAYQTMDFHIVGNSATGTIAAYMSGTERMAATTADLSAVTGIETVRLYNSTQGSLASQIIIADEPTIGWRLMTLVPSGNGATTDWSGGDYSSVDETTYSDADFIYSDTADQVELMAVTPRSTITGYVVRAVGVYCRARRGSSGPQNLQLALRSGSTTGTSGSKALSLGYSSYGHIWETNPDTTAAWLASQISSIQVGVKSIT